MSIRYRALSGDGDYRFGAGHADFLQDVDAVAQAVRTRLLLFQNEWWEDLSEGLPFWTGIAGQARTEENKAAADLLIQDRILGTPGVRQILSFESEYTEPRSFKVRTTIDTIYGQTTVEVPT